MSQTTRTAREMWCVAIAVAMLCAHGAAPFTLDRDETVDVPAETLGGDWALSAGRLVLGGGVVTMSFAEGGPRPAAGMRVKLISFDSVEGTAAIRFEGRPARAVMESDGLYAEFFQTGTNIIIR